MPAYSFQPQFVEPIRLEVKGGTIRAHRKIPASWSTTARNRRPGGHARPGEELSLYCRQRHPSGFLITSKVCKWVHPILLDFAGDGRIVYGDHADTIHAAIGLALFARFDGFESWEALRAFWHRTHPGLDHFRGWHIGWHPLPI